MLDVEKMHLKIKNPQILVRNCKFRTVDSTMDIHNVPEGMYVLLCGKFSQPITIE